MKVAIIGGYGGLGSTTAFCLGYHNVVDEIKLLGRRQNMLKSHAVDMGQAFLPVGKTKVTPADYPDIRDCDIILCCASVPEGKVKDRSDIFGANIEVMVPICEKIRQYGNPNAAVIISSAPIDVWAYCFWKLIGWKPNQFLGFCVNDELRFKWAIEQVTGKAFEKLDATVIGEHGGDGMVRLYDQIRYDGRPFALTAEERAKVEALTTNWFQEWQALEAGRTTTWTSGVMLSRMVQLMVEESDEIIPASTPLASVFGFEGVAMGMPCRLGKGGVREVVDPHFTEDQLRQLAHTTAKLKGQIAQVPMENVG